MVPSEHVRVTVCRISPLYKNVTTAITPPTLTTATIALTKGRSIAPALIAT